MTTSVGGEALPGREKGGDDANWIDTNLTGPKNDKNSRGQFNCYIQMDGKDLNE
jgi:hypothetical protein